MKYGTKIIHNGHAVDPVTGALSIPIYQVSTFHQEDVEKGQKYEYSRSGNPTREALEETIAALENGQYGFAFASGIAAVASVLSIFKSGDHLVICQDIYGGTHRLMTQFFSKYGITCTWVDATSVEEVERAIKEETVAIYLETPSNPLLKVTPLESIANLAKARGVLTIIDNTFMTPYLQRPLDLGIDIIIHSATKFIGGHSDVVAGLVVVKEKALAKQIKFVQNAFGAILGPQDSWLLLRGLKTLKVRLDYQQATTEKLAQWLQEQPQVKAVYYPGLVSHPGYAIHKQQADGGGAVFSFETYTEEVALAFMKRIKTAAVAVSLGGVETIVSYPKCTSHAAVPVEERVRLGISDTLIRVSVGLEEIEDLIEDFNQALKA